MCTFSAFMCPLSYCWQRSYRITELQNQSYRNQEAGWMRVQLSNSQSLCLDSRPSKGIVGFYSCFPEHSCSTQMFFHELFNSLKLKHLFLTSGTLFRVLNCWSECTIALWNKKHSKSHLFQFQLLSMKAGLSFLYGDKIDVAHNYAQLCLPGKQAPVCQQSSQSNTPLLDAIVP